MNIRISVLLLAAVAFVGCDRDKNSGNSSAGDAGDVRPIDRPDAAPDTAPDAGPDTRLDAPDATPEIGPDAPDELCPGRLQAVTLSPMRVARDARVDLDVRYIDCLGDPAEDVQIDYAFTGPFGDATLRTRRAFTDDDGLASVELQASSSNMRLRVDVVGPGVEPIGFDIVVSSEPVGGIEVEIDEATSGVSTHFSVFLFAGANCEELDRFDPFGALAVVEPVDSIADPVAFDFIEARDDYAVLVQSFARSSVTGFGCVEAIEVLDGEITEVIVTVSDMPVVFNGVYELENQFDLAGVLPPSVEETLRVLDELTDDDSLEGDHLRESYGIDPAAFLADIVFRQFCCWEATGPSPDWDSCNAQPFTHPLGDLTQLYTESFNVWEGAQPLQPSLCGMLELGTNELVQTSIQDFIDANVPELGLALLDMTGDLARAITDMHIISELEVGEILVGKNGRFTHTLKTMIVSIRGLDGEDNVFEFDLEDAGLTNLEYSAETTTTDGVTLEIPYHTFRLDFGLLLRFIFTDILIPMLECDRDHDGRTNPCESTADLLGTWIDCADVGRSLEESFTFVSASIWEGFCHAGVDWGGATIEEELARAIDAETILGLEGTCDAGELDDRFEAVTLVDGVWEGQLVEDDTSFGEFPGAFHGERIARP